MKKISCQLLWTKPVSLSRAAKLVSRFAAVENGSSAAVSLYLQRTADAFNHLVQFRNKRPTNSEIENSPDRKRPEKPQTDWVEKKSDVKSARDSKSRGKKDRETVNAVAEANPCEDGAKLKSGEAEEEEEKKKKKKKKRKSDDVDSKEKSRSKKKKLEGHNS